MHALHFRKTNKKLPCLRGQNHSALLLPGLPGRGTASVACRQQCELTRWFLPCSPAWPFLKQNDAFLQHAAAYNQVYFATIVTFCNMFCTSKSSSSLVSPPQQLASSAFSPLSKKSPGWPPASSSASSSTTPQGVLTFQPPAARSPRHHKPTLAARSYFLHPHKQLQILFPFRWFPSDHLPNYPDSQMDIMTHKYKTLNYFIVQEL